LPDLRMHRTGVNDAFFDRLSVAFAQIFLRARNEFRPATSGAEIVGAALVLGTMLGGVRSDRHATNRINGANGWRFRMVVMVSSHWLHLAPHTPRGYIEDMAKDSKTTTLKRLNRIEGQVRGLARMVEDDRYCIDIVTQIGAARAALRRVEEEILRSHVAHCVDHAIKSGTKADQRRKVAELMDVMGRAAR